MAPVYYSVSDRDPDLEERLGPVDTGMKAWGAEECARHYWSDKDGWESQWPLKFRLFCGSEVKDFEVDLQRTPSFLARDLT